MQTLAVFRTPYQVDFQMGVLKQELYRILVTRFFESNNFGHNETMKVIFFSKWWKFYLDFENSLKLAENIASFEDDSVWTCCWSFFELWQEYMWPAANVLKSGSKISDPTKRHHTQASFFDVNGTFAWKWCPEDFSSVFDPLTRWFAKGVLKQELYGTLVTTFFRINKFENI